MVETAEQQEQAPCLDGGPPLGGTRFETAGEKNRNIQPTNFSNIVYINHLLSILKSSNATFSVCHIHGLKHKKWTSGFVKHAQRTVDATVATSVVNASFAASSSNAAPSASTSMGVKELLKQATFQQSFTYCMP